MTLRPDPATPGLWVDPAWQEGMPGSFAVVIGASHYPHLDGGGEPALDQGQEWIAEIRTLGQLYVSALTARRFFDWLATDYRYAKAPIAKCWLLLSPTEAERAHEPAIDDHMAEPTLDNCAKALKAWRKAIRALPAAAQHESRAFFFFSGHGLQVHHGRHLLLPSSYLGGDEPSWDEAIGTSNLLYGLESLEIPDRYYFLDACRNDLPKLRAKRPEGQRILSEDEAALAFVGLRTGALLYATNAALRAWQPTAPEDGVSLFGQAVLEGLAGRPDIELLPRDDRLAVVLTKLHGFTRARVLELMQEHGSLALQSVMLDGPRGEESTVTELDPAAIAAFRPLPSPPTGRPPVIARARNTPPARPAATRGLDLRRMRAEALVHATALEPTIARGTWARDLDLGHALFGSERVTDLWQNDTRVTALTGRREIGADAIELLNVAHDEAARVFRLDVRIDAADPLGYWLEAGGGMAGEERHGVVLPTDPAGPLIYRIEAEIERLDGPSLYSRRLLRLDARLAPSTGGPAGEAARLWRTYATADAEAAVDVLEAGGLRTLGRGKLESPLAATIAALVLLGAGRLDFLENWLPSLAERFPDRPDGAVLMAERILRREPDREAAVAGAVHWLARLNDHGLPVTAETLSYALSQTERLNRVRHLIPETLVTGFDALRDRLGAALVAFRPNGLFTSYAGFDPKAPPIFSPPGPQNPPPPGPMRINETENGIQIGSQFLPRNRG